MKRIFSALTYLLLLCAFMASTLFALGYRDYTKPGPLPEKIMFVAARGQGVSTIASHLAQQGVISQPLLFKFAARISGQQAKLNAGEYEFPAHISMRDVLDQMVGGGVYQRHFTVPEGLTSWQVVKLLNETPGLTGEITDIPPEGSLLPETYNYMYGDTRQSEIDKMKKAMDEAVQQAWDNRPKDAPLLSKAEAVILASIIEKETGVAQERRRISGVFHNRLKKGIPLQTDPTVIYAITKGHIQDNGMGPLGRRLLSKDLQFESPYNTYKYPGLPPGPIANPGRAAIEAALNPEANDFYYFVADGTGGHVFSKTLEEHNRNAAKWRHIRAKK